MNVRCIELGAILFIFITQLLSLALAKTPSVTTESGKRWQNPYTTQLPYQAWASLSYGQSFGHNQYSFSTIRGGAPLWNGKEWFLGSNLETGGAYLNIPYEERSLWIPFAGSVEVVARRHKKSSMTSGYGLRVGVPLAPNFITYWTNPLQNTESVGFFRVKRRRVNNTEIYTRIDAGINSFSGVHLTGTLNITTPIIEQKLAVQFGFQGGLPPAIPLHLTCNWSPVPNLQVAVGAMGYVPDSFLSTAGSFPIEPLVSIGYQR